mgnify:CR=1 FL=1
MMPWSMKIVHIIPDTLGYGFPFQLGKDRGNIHHGPTHGGGRVELLFDGDEVDFPAS